MLYGIYFSYKGTFSRNTLIDKIEEKKSENIERKLTLKIKELEKEIKANTKSL